MKTRSAPKWVPARKVGRLDITPVAWFSYSFDELVRRFDGRASVDKGGGGAGPNRFIVIQMSYGKFAAFTSWAKEFPWQEPERECVELSLRVNERGVAYLDDVEEALELLGVPLKRVKRQGAFNWHRRKRAA